VKDKIEKLVQDLVRIDSTQGKSIHAINHLTEFLNDHGFSAQIDNYSKGEANLVAKIGSNNESIVLSGHIDTVPIGDPKKWTYNPYSGQIVDNELWGRGSVDMKGGVGAITRAFIELQEVEKELNYEIKLVISAEEEVGLAGAKILQSKGIMNNAKYLLIAEPTDLEVAIMEKGIMWLKFNAFGKQSHASRPDLGKNAIEGLYKLLPLLYNVLPDLSIDPVGKTSLNVGTLNGGSTPNVVPETANMVIDIRTTPGINNDELIANINKILEEESQDDLAYDMEIMANASSVKSVTTNFAQSLIDETQKYYKTSGKLGATFYATDAAELLKDKNIEFAIYGPGSVELLHQTNERLDLKQLDICGIVISNTVKNLSTS
jgi:succinyl-diaminopimelate desuccinylase